MLLSNTPRFRIFRRRKNSRSSSPSQTTRNELHRLVHTSEPMARKVCRFLHLRPSFAYLVERNDTPATLLCIISIRRSMQRCRHSSNFTLATSPTRTADETCTRPLLSLVDSILHVVVSDWKKIQTPDADRIISFDQLPRTADPRALSKLAILKLDGGPGTSVGTYFVSPYPCMRT